MPVTSLTHDQLLQCYRTSVRTRTWRRLHYLGKALFRASLDYLKSGGRILNVSLLAKLSQLVELLTETRGQRIVKRGVAKATAILIISELTVYFQGCTPVRYSLTCIYRLGIFFCLLRIDSNV